MDDRNYDDTGARGPRALDDPRNRQLLFIIGGTLLALLLALAAWQSSGTRGAKRDYAGARERVMEKEKEVAEARSLLEQRIAELRAVSAEADVEAAKLGSSVQQQIGGAIEDARVDGNADTRGTRTTVSDPSLGATPQVYYVRDEQGRFVPVARP